MVSNSTLPPQKHELLGADDRSWLEGLTRRLIQSGRATVRLDDQDYPIYQASGSGQYPAFWTRDSVWISMSGLLPVEHIRSMLQVMALTQNGPNELRLAHGLRVPPWSIADHVTLAEGEPVWFPGVWKGGDDQGSGRYGWVAAQDASYMFIELAQQLIQQTGTPAVLAEEAGGVRLLDRLERAFWAPEYDEDTQLAFCSDETRAVAFSDAIIKTGYLLDGSLLRWRAANRLAGFKRAVGRQDEAGRYEEIALRIQRALPEKLWHETIPQQEGWLQSASGIARQSCIRGTCFALALGILDDSHARMASHALRKVSTAPTLDQVPEGDQITYQGHLRHLLRGEYWWDTPMSRDSYQNGGYWGMFSGWYLCGSELTDPEFASETARLLVNYLRRNNFHDGSDPENRGAPYEWILPDGTAVGPKYLPNLTLLWRALNGGFAVC